MLAAVQYISIRLPWLIHVALAILGVLIVGAVVAIMLCRRRK